MFTRLTFSHKILLAASLVVIGVFSLFSFYAYSLQRQATTEYMEGYLSDLGQSTANSLQNWFSGRIALVQNLAQNLAGIPEYEVADLLNQPLMTSSFVEVFRGTADGGFIVRPSSVQITEGYDPRTRGWYRDALQKGTIITAPYVSANSGKMSVTIAQRIDANAVAGSDLDMDAIVQMIRKVDFSGLGHAFIVDARGSVLVHPNEDLLGKRLEQLYPQNTPRLSSEISTSGNASGEQLVSFVPVQLADSTWYVGVDISKDKAFHALYQFRTSAVIATVLGALLVIVLLGLLIRVLMRPLITMGRAMQDIAEGEGDLTRRLEIHSQDEFGKLAGAFNRFVERIHASIREVATATGQLNEVTVKVVGASNASMANSDEQASRTNSVAAAINELGAAAQEIARNAADASGHASEAREQAEDSRQVVETTIRVMSELSAQLSDSCGNIESLNDKTTDIGQILEVIQGISEQTNLLALNAAIEAARAGEAGRGFAVVADEVRNLAHRTQSSAQEIQQMIEELQVGSRQSVQVMLESQQVGERSVQVANQAGERLGVVTQHIGEIDGMNQSVATATEEQTSVIEALNMDITEINTLNQQGVDNLQDTLRACGELEREANRLKQLVGGFRI